jgi:hypothetical protein
MRLLLRRNWALQERVVVGLVCAKFEDILEDIATSKPWSMSLSNVIDYVDQTEIHRMARACSVHSDTVHFAYSINWPMYVFGVNIIDYQGKEQTNLRAQIIESANDSVEKAYKMFGWENNHNRSLCTRINALFDLDQAILFSCEA